MNNTEKKLIVDVDKAIEVFKEKNPNKDMDRHILAEKIGKKYQDLVNLKNGRTPNFLKVLDKIISETGINYNDLVKKK